MWHDLYRIAQEFTVWKRWAATGNLEHPFFSGCTHRMRWFQPNGGMGHGLHDTRQAGMVPLEFGQRPSEDFSHR